MKPGHGLLCTVAPACGLLRKAAGVGRRLRTAALGLALAAAAATAPAAVLPYCEPPPERDAAQHDTLLRLTALVRQELQSSGAGAALIARSGLDLQRFGARYSHAGISLAAGPVAPWSVRQLFFDCDERRSRLFDQGLAGFLLGQHAPGAGYVSLVLLPQRAAAPLAAAALDDGLALALLGARYSANAYPWSTRYQNCNQWVAELMAAAWGGLRGPGPLRERAQEWLRAAAYRPSPMALRPRALLFAAPFVPWVQVDDHPEEALRAGVFEVSMPAALEDLARALEPQARRIELCHTAGRIVLRRGWTPLPEGCVPEAGDEVF